MTVAARRGGDAGEVTGGRAQARGGMERREGELTLGGNYGESGTVRMTEKELKEAKERRATKQKHLLILICSSEVIKYFSGCSKFLKSNIVPSNFLDIWAFADLLMGTTSNFLEVMKMEEFLKLTLAL